MTTLLMNGNSENYSGAENYNFPEMYHEIESPVNHSIQYGPRNNLTYGSLKVGSGYSFRDNIYSNPEKVNLEVMANSAYVPESKFETLPVYLQGHASLKPLTSYGDDSDLISALFAKIEKEKRNFYKKRKKKDILHSSWFFNRMTEFC
jgi:hypothetical protein